MPLSGLTYGLDATGLGAAQVPVRSARSPLLGGIPGVHNAVCAEADRPRCARTAFGRSAISVLTSVDRMASWTFGVQRCLCAGIWSSTPTVLLWGLQTQPWHSSVPARKLPSPCFPWRNRCSSEGVAPRLPAPDPTIRRFPANQEQQVQRGSRTLWELQRSFGKGSHITLLLGPRLPPLSQRCHHCRNDGCFVEKLFAPMLPGQHTCTPWPPTGQEG